MNLLEINDLRVNYPGVDRRPVEVLHGIDLAVERGQRLAVVGESGSGKSVTARSILRLDPDATIYGSIRLGDEEITTASRRRLRTLRGAHVGFVFQDPLTALNPVMRIGWQIMQPLVIRGVDRKQARSRGIDLLTRLGVEDAEHRFNDYPHQFSGGMRQRVVLAIAVIAGPELLIADEPTTALDVRVQAQVLQLLSDLSVEREMAVVLISHDLGIVAGFADIMVVMRNGRILERGDVDAVYSSPQTEYTRGLLGAVPRLDADPDLELATIPPQREMP